jgi:hypothetical protein
MTWARGREFTLTAYIFSDSIATFLFDLQNLRGAEYRFVSLFPWTLVSLHSLWEFNHSDIGNEWHKFIEAYAGSIVVGTTKELYVVRLQPSGKQGKQIRLDTVSLRCTCQFLDAGLNGQGQGGRPITAVTWALGRALPLDPLLVVAMSSMVCVYSVGRGEPVGFLRGHGGVCLRFLSVTIFSNLRIANFLHHRSSTKSFLHLHRLLRPDSENL